jgi:hypothetical protein
LESKNLLLLLFKKFSKKEPKRKKKRFKKRKGKGLEFSRKFWSDQQEIRTKQERRDETRLSQEKKLKKIHFKELRMTSSDVKNYMIQAHHKTN